MFPLQQELKEEEEGLDQIDALPDLAELEEAAALATTKCADCLLSHQAGSCPPSNPESEAKTTQEEQEAGTNDLKSSLERDLEGLDDLDF